MSDDEFGFDDFADESFLRAVDDIETRAVQATPANFERPSATSSNNAGPSTVNHTVVPAASVATTARNPANPPFRPPGRATNAGISRPESSGASSRRAAVLGVRLPPPEPIVVPSSDDFDDASFSAEALAQIDEVAATASTGTLTGRPPPRLPNANRGIKRTFSRSTSSGLQTHLNFRREPTYTKGKRWDRTVFAASGRRLDAEKRKKKGRRRRNDEDEEEDEEFDDEDEDPFGLEPPPPVDMNKPYEPQRHIYNPVTIKDYLYPTNHPKRDYQYEIIRACFTDNCLVALPTGLGKTFVAGVVMLNFYRWFPTGKIVFLAPTKPLVNQQIEACQLTCGIPSSDAAVMTGASVSAKERERMWEERRVFYCTPQTLDNDLKRGAVDPRDIVLAVFDEAHKASGSYAYTTILAYITAHHPYFRVLALTATPGGDVPKVQGVVDALHISRIEIREAEAPEIKKYMNEKITERHVVPPGSLIAELRDRWATLMKPFIQKLVEKNVLTERDLDAKRLRTFRLTARRMEILRGREKGLMWAQGPLSQLEKMARAMAYLLEFSLGMFHTSLLEIAGHTKSEGKKGNSLGGAFAMRNNLEFQRILGDVEGEINAIERRQDGKTPADRHPKMHKTLELLLAYFAQAQEDERVHGIKNDTRAMVFCSFRHCVLDVVDMLNDHPELLRATKFVGQSQGKQERDKGFNQKEQKKTVQEFKEGKYNVLVSTSIGEEGLDIGEVDFVVIYDMPKQSIKLLQRIGRTGRKRDGYVHVLMSQNREDMNWDTAQQTHRDIQEEILHSRNLELFEDVERLLPPGPLPACTEQRMEIDPWDPSDHKKKRALPSATQEQVSRAKTKRAPRLEIPDGAPDGFRSVAELLRLGAKKRRKSAVHSDDGITSESEGEGSDTAEHELLYGAVPSASSGKKTRGTTKKPAARKRAKTKSTKPATPSPTKSEIEREERERAHTQLVEEAMAFFATTSVIRARTPTPTPTSPSQFVPSLPTSPKLDLEPAQVCVLSSDEE